MNHIKTIIEQVQNKKVISRYFVFTLTLIISALYYNMLLNPAKIVSGGTTGLATIFYHTMKIDPSIFILVSSGILLIFSFIFLGLEYSISALYVTIVFPIFVKITASLTEVIDFTNHDLIIVAAFAGVLAGVTNGICYRIGFSTGGLNIISQILYKYKKISITITGTIMSILIVGAGAFIFGINSALYATIYIYVSQLAADRILLGISKEKAFYIISTKSKKIREAIHNEMGHGTTVFNTKGGSFLIKQRAIMAVVPTSEYFQLKKLIKEIDRKAFIVITDSYEVKGGI